MSNGKLMRDVTGLTIVKVLVLVWLYLLFFGPSHRPPVDTAAHILGAVASVPRNPTR